VYPDGVLKMITLIKNESVRIAKTQATVSIDSPPVEEVVDLGDNKCAGEADADV
jgi:hypothetical protein